MRLRITHHHLLNLYTAASKKLPEPACAVPDLLLNTFAPADSTLNSGMRVIGPNLMLAESVLAKILAPAVAELSADN